ncbi:MAG TPA: hypothetical protein VFB00_09655, partial [Terriglobales bacterium]|nr:hypothetical protein [Terriglobales bacterium]
VRKLQRLIRSSGYFRQKARKLKRFVSFLDQQHGGSLNRMFAQPTSVLREQLLSLNGVGPETADSILLYAGQRPVFVVDAYTKRIAARHAILAENASYEDVRQLFERSLTGCAVMPAAAMTACGPAALQPSRMSLARRSGRVQVFNEMHGLIVGVGKQYCLKARPKCEECPLRQLLPAAGLASRVGPDSPGI